MKSYTLENIEWTQYWTEDSESGKRKVLLIGDSISVGYRSEVNARIGDGLSITAYSTSKAVDNPWFLEELAMNVKQHDFDYDIVTLNNGLHGFHLSAAEYEAGMRRLIDGVRSLLPEAKLWLVLSTPITVYGQRDTLNGELNKVVLERNEVVRRLAEEYGLPVIDLYATVVDRPTLRSEDGYHYNGEGYGVIADEIAGKILG